MIALMQPEHVEAVKDLLDTCFDENSWSVESIQSELEKADSRCTVAVEDSKVVGFLAFEQIMDEGSIVEIAVSPDHRRRGIARALINEALRNCTGLCTVFLEVREGNVPAVALYESLGFERIAIRRGYYDKPKENAIIMRKNYENTGY
ncbi:ribosomal protein S18-alanine N-acetyltransferase [uncultured Ruminococcus sp.]|uniref:ribosomal protein S18-alanine N-acetyltransferase n=1 Tax=uncultured Ruminococcus sp. TaxID=165186 RepID=UPI00292FD1C5|nr:ribosomal protein S18-alanine N-acetyltransferase [uncultured Ruminococcus sp.]